MEAFVYCWTDILTGKLYVGYHKGSPDDGYVCSSKIMIQEYKTRPRDFTRSILATGETSKMREIEEQILKNMEAARNPMFYNQHNGNRDFYVKKHSEKSKRAMSRKRKGIPKGPFSEEHKRKLSEAHKGKIITEETRRKISISSKGRQVSEDTKNKLSKIATGRKHTEETLHKMSLQRKGRKLSPDHVRKLHEGRKNYIHSQEHKAASRAWMNSYNNKKWNKV